MYAGQVVQSVMHLGHDAKASAAAAQCPKKLLLIVALGDNDPPIREDDLRSEKIIKREAEAADQWPITPAQGETGHAYGADGARYGREAEWIRRRDNVCGTGTPRDL